MKLRWHRYFGHKAGHGALGHLLRCTSRPLCAETWSSIKRFTFSSCLLHFFLHFSYIRLRTTITEFSFCWTIKLHLENDDLFKFCICQSSRRSALGEIIIGKDEGNEGSHGKVFILPGGRRNQDKRGNEGKILGTIGCPCVAVVLFAEAHVAFRVALRHTNVVNL